MTRPRRFIAWLATSLLAGGAHADSSIVTRTVTIAGLFPADQARSLAPTMRTDRKVTLRLRVPPGAGPHGVLVFVHPGPSAEPMRDWPDVLDRHDLVYVAAQGFGNDTPGNQRALAALLALTSTLRSVPIDARRRYIGGMSGGGKMASQILARFPAYFDGALCIVGAEYVEPAASTPDDASRKRIVFMTGNRDFNHYDVLAVHRRVVAAGLATAHLMDIPGFTHQYPDAAQLDAALDLLDPR